MAKKQSKKPMKATAKVKAKPNNAAKAKVMIGKNKSPVTKAFTKTEILSEISLSTGLTRGQAGAVLESLQHVIGRHLKKGGIGAFVLPGLLKCQVIHKPATKARKGINPFTGEETMFKAKPARNIVKVRPLKKLKEMV